MEAMEIVEMYCDLLLARFGLVSQMKELDEGIAEAVSSIIWVAPRLQSDCQVKYTNLLFSEIFSLFCLIGIKNYCRFANSKIWCPVCRSLQNRIC